MEFANLRLKFIPTLKDIDHCNTKCCLEIVPEVSFVKNIDKIEWTSDCDSIVYHVPMTYKITLKKKPSEEKSLDKTYHSCVDLLTTSSLSNINFASGDVSRFMSDTFIVSSINTNSEGGKEESVVVYNSNTNETDKCVTIKANTSNKTTEVLLDETNSVSSNEEEQDNGMVIPSAEVIPIGYEDDEEQCKSEVLENIETLNKKNVSSSISATKVLVSKRKLSITPICSVDTTDRITHIPDVNPIDVLSYDSIYFKIFKNENLFKTNLVSKNQIIQTNNVVLHKPMGYLHNNPFNCTEDPERPEIKVANFVKNMELEIMPLKVMLNDIIRKCSKLGLINKENTFKPPVYPVPAMIKEQPKNINLGNACWREIQPKSNRVVYSIVFDT